MDLKLFVNTDDDVRLGRRCNRIKTANKISNTRCARTRPKREKHLKPI